MADLTILYDGGCPLCRREVTFLERRDLARHPGSPKLAFVDIDRADYRQELHQGVSYREAMGTIHGIEAGGTVLLHLAVFRRAYELIGLGWLYAPTRWPVVGPLAEAAYGLWARLRLVVTGRPSLEQLCTEREGCGVPAGAGRLRPEG
jgi:predicted DCC family thiol-disulfide oxidoreductase YuxK